MLFVSCILDGSQIKHVYVFALAHDVHAYAHKGRGENEDYGTYDEEEKTNVLNACVTSF